MYLILACMLLAGTIAASNDVSNDISSVNKNLKFKFKFETKLETGFGDYDNGPGLKIQLAKNQPEYEHNLYFFWRVKNKKNKQLYAGPYFDFDLGFRWDYSKSSGPDAILHERARGGVEAGAKIIYRFNKKPIKDSTLTVSLPFHFETDALYNGAYFLVSALSVTDLRRYHTATFLGTRPAAQLALNFKKFHLKLDERLRIPLLFDVANEQFAFSEYRMLLGFDNRVRLAMAPFKFINKKVDVWLTAQVDTEMNWIAGEVEFENSAWFEIKWTGLKYLHLGWKPIWHEIEFDLPLDGGVPYGQELTISMDIWLKARVKFFEFIFGYRPYLYALDKREINLSEDKPHIIYTSILFKI